MKIIPTLVVLATCLLSTSLGAPQLFPFSNLRSYFDHQARSGPGNEKSAATPELTTIVDTPIFRQPAKAEEFSTKVLKYPINHLPPNHKLDVTPSLEPPSASAAASPIVNYQPPIPEQVLKAPDAVPPIIYGHESSQDKSNNEGIELRVLPTYVSQIPLTVVGEKYVPYDGLVPPTQRQIIQGLSPASIQNPSVILLPTGPVQNLQNSVPTSEYINEKIIQKNKEISTKNNKPLNNSYPKKWQPEKEKEAVKTKYPKGGEGNLNVEKNSDILKEQQQMKEQQQSIEASSNYQKKILPLYPVLAAPRVPSLGEQVASETGFTDITAGVGGYGGGVGGDGGGIGGERVEFQMHGQHGPHSYKFGYDTGKGHNRQFRYEERDNHGHVKGHYGFYNKHGKLQIVNYSAHPEHGFQADGNYGKHGIA